MRLQLSIILWTVLIINPHPERSLSRQSLFERREPVNDFAAQGNPLPIPFKSNSKAQTNYGPKSTLWTRMLDFYNDNREEFLTHYHKRSNVETTFHMIKAKFGQRLRSKTLTAQINEALCKVLCHNLCVVIQSQHELGIELDFSEANAA